MDYARRVENVPPGWRRYSMADVRRLPPEIIQHDFRCVPSDEMARIEAEEPAACERLVQAMFWPCVYHLEPHLWDALAAAEPIHSDVINALGNSVGRALDVGAGSGRLTSFLVDRSADVTAIEPSRGLREMLLERHPSVRVIAAFAESLPLVSRAFDLVAACGSVGPDPAVIAELERVRRPGGRVVLISPEDPSTFESMGWRRLCFDPIQPLPHDAWIDELFGPLDPPHELLILEA